MNLVCDFSVSESCKLLLFLLPLFLFMCMYVCVYLLVYMYHVPAGAGRGQKVLYSLEWQLQWLSYTHVVGGYWDLNLCPLQEPQVFLTVGPSWLVSSLNNNTLYICIYIGI